ncbi:uncharacterized protein K02A2.6-like [Heteronotia binoei]|uniref:uncharacterized protein K02A2.6-like n=2 Tax=Heteronotia binoei TaxID=13085 RepID=UPI0029314FC0|nr:uncharacterized protein K02A2.6-like [Heteronotia binoei]
MAVRCAELDSSCKSISIISEETLKKLCPHRRLQTRPADFVLRDFQKNPVHIVGWARVHVERRGFRGPLDILVVKRQLTTLLGLAWFNPLGIQLVGVDHLQASNFDGVCREFPEVFDGSLGSYKGPPITLPIDPMVRPIRLKARRVPFALKPKIEAELDRLTAQGVLEPVTYAEWETPIVTPVKPNGEVRICADYKCTINKALQDNPYPVPVVSHVLAALAGAKTIVTHRGAFRVKRLQFGVSVAPGIFQSIMDSLLKGIPGVQPFFDDVLIAAPNEGERFTIATDHKPLLGLLAPDRQTPQILSQRVLRWNQFLNSYTYELVHRPGKAMGHADALSRLPLPMTEPDPAPAHGVMLIESLPERPLHAAEVARATGRDRILARVRDWVGRGWPSGKVEDAFRPFASRKDELSTHKGCVLWGSRVVVPPPLRKQVLEDLHETHPGIVRMKALARSYVWWPGMDEEIEGWVRRCQPCQESRPDPPSAPVHRWESNRRPWSRLHLDFAGPYQGQIFFILVDAYTKWLEVIPVASTSTAAAVRALRRVLCTHGIPDTLVTDNGTAFTSREFREFTERYLIRHIRSAPFHPATNGQAERMVRTTKEALGRMRKLTTRLDRLHPDRAPEVRGSPEVREAVRGFFPGDPVYAKNFASGPNLQKVDNRRRAPEATERPSDRKHEHAAERETTRGRLNGKRKRCINAKHWLYLKRPERWLTKARTLPRMS